MRSASPIFHKTKQLAFKVARPLKVAAYAIHRAYQQTTKLDKAIMAAALTFAGGSVVWAAATPAVSGGTTTSGAGTQVQIYDWGGNQAVAAHGRIGYNQDGARPWRVGAAQTDCSGWTSFVDGGTKKLIASMGAGNLTSFGSATTLGMAQTTAGRGEVVYARPSNSTGFAAPPNLTDLKPGMIILHGSTESQGARKWQYGGAGFAINHVGIVVRVGGRLMISDVRNDGGRSDLLGGSTGHGGVNLYSSTQLFLNSAKNRINNKSYSIIVADPLKSVRVAIGDSATATISGDMLASGETPNQGEIGGKTGIFGQPLSGADNQIEDGEYLGDANLQGTGYSGMFHDVVMGRAASSAYQRGLAGASEPRLLAELAYMRTIQNIMMQGMRESKARQETMAAAYLAVVTKAAESDRLARQAALAAQAGGAQAVQATP